MTLVPSCSSWRGRCDRLHGGGIGELWHGFARESAAIWGWSGLRRTRAECQRPGRAPGFHQRLGVFQARTVPTNEELGAATPVPDSSPTREAIDDERNASTWRFNARRPDFKANRGLLGGVPPVTGSGGCDPEGRLDDRTELLTVEPYKVDDRRAAVHRSNLRRPSHTMGAGVDELVLICQGLERRATETEKLPVDAVAIGSSTPSTWAGKSFSPLGGAHESQDAR